MQLYLWELYAHSTRSLCARVVYSVMFTLKCFSGLAPVFFYCLRRSLSTVPALESDDTGRGVKVGRALEIGFMRRCGDPAELAAAEVMRGTAADRGAKNGLDSGFFS